MVEYVTGTVCPTSWIWRTACRAGYTLGFATLCSLIMAVLTEKRYTTHSTEVETLGRCAELNDEIQQLKAMMSSDTNRCRRAQNETERPFRVSLHRRACPLDEVRIVKIAD